MTDVVVIHGKDKDGANIQETLELTGAEVKTTKQTFFPPWWMEYITPKENAAKGYITVVTEKGTPNAPRT